MISFDITTIKSIICNLKLILSAAMLFLNELQVN